MLWQLLPSAIIIVAFAVIAIAALLPDDKENPDRLFGITLGRGGGEKHQHVTRLLLAARAIVRRSADHDGGVDVALPQDIHLDDELDIEDRREVPEPEPMPQVAVVAIDEKAGEEHDDAGAGGDVFPAASFTVDGSPVAELDDVVLDDRHVEPAELVIAAPEALPAVEPLVAEGERQPVVAEALHEAAKAEESQVEEPEEPAAEIRTPEAGRAGRSVMWPRLVGLDPTILSVAERTAIVATLSAIGESYLTAVFCEILDQEDDTIVREMALEAIRDARLAGAIGAVSDALASSRDRERVLAVEALAAIGADAELHVALGDRCVAVVTAAAAALRRSHAISDDQLRTELAKNGDDEHVERVTEILATIG